MSGLADMVSVDMLLWGLLGYVVFPVWLLSGVADYLCHARSDIAHTSGTHESVLHLLQTAEIGLPVLVFLFLTTNALTLALMTAGVVAHTATSWRDVTFAAPLRHISPGEQYVHSFLNVLPWIALALVAILHWPMVVAMFDPAIASDWKPRWRQPAFNGATLFVVLAASLLFGALPGALEFMHTLAVARRDQASSSSDRSSVKLP
jgi:small-conductance mechanosensitive channel